ncbi:acyl-CoA dehydrogenase family protein [Planctomicrobium piriforme]|uniref:Acyl-CoA dehydrogenase n=1 Tax=Planctomicrobium piriforme TaxID=1576369 RepID=A0A1I3L1P6_9PLAN|nr:acyl-CoA dehydrogenase family protein [Planctomicrobium piriforme]SFI78315.1 Acyl-CoA dehydrogenase [Planctomicrobium piriforme]
MSTIIRDDEERLAQSSPEPRPVTPPVNAPSFAETAMRLGGKSEDEARRMGAVDAADERVEEMFDPRYQTAASPIHRAIWDRSLPFDHFTFPDPPRRPSAAAAEVMEASYQIVRRHVEAGTMIDRSNGKIPDNVFEELAAAGYWGLLVDQKYGGYGASFSQFAPFLTRMATVDPTIAGLASVHACIGAVDPVQTFGNEEQKRRFLPKLASGQALSAFALTEPGAGSDLTALRTHAVLEGDEFLLYGEKLFITNVRPGRTVGVVCLIDDTPAVLIVDLPPTETDEFQLKKYGLYALKHAYNQGIIFNGLRVPAKNLLDPGRGDGLTIAYHGLNRGRVALCANASGTMRMMLANLLPWAQFRETYGEAIVKRELVRRRIGHLAGLIVACDALTQWTASLLDLGFRGEMECIIAKIFGSEAQKEATIELSMKTHGGRSFLHGHWFGDNVHDLLAPCIYEGEGEMLGMAFFKSLVKEHGRKYFEPIGRTLHDQGIKTPDLMNPSHAWALREPLMHYARWFAEEGARVYLTHADASGVKRARSANKGERRVLDSLDQHLNFSASFLRRSRLEISGVMRKYQLKLPDRQCRMAELSARVQAAVVMLCTSLYGVRQADPLTRAAANVACTSLRHKLDGKRYSDGELRALTSLGTKIADGGFEQIAGIPVAEILMPYSKG